MPRHLIAPSLLAADFARLAEEIERVEAAGADWLHVDVMDGHFVSNITIGPPVVAAIAKVATKPVDVHLMIEDPWRYADAFIDAGADILTIHYELHERGDLGALIQKVKARGCKVGLAINPDGDIRGLTPWLPDLDMVLVMSVFPGFGGQSFMPEVLAGLRLLRDDLGFEGLIEMDGGIDLETVGLCAAAGCDVFVAGTAVFGAPDLAHRIQDLRQTAEEASGCEGFPRLEQ